jgi:hypothetical protein
MRDFSQFSEVNVKLDFVEPLNDSCFVQIILNQSRLCLLHVL